MAYKKTPRVGVTAPKTAAEKRTVSLRRSNASGFDWGKVDGDLLRAALWAACLDGSALMFSPATGGRGACLKLYVDGGKITEYATEPGEMNDLLEQVIAELSSGSEDILSTVKMNAKPVASLTELRRSRSVHADKTKGKTAGAEVREAAAD